MPRPAGHGVEWKKCLHAGIVHAESKVAITDLKRCRLIVD